MKRKSKKMKPNYEGGNYGMMVAKQALFELIIERFSERKRNLLEVNGESCHH